MLHRSTSTSVVITSLLAAGLALSACAASSPHTADASDPTSTDPTSTTPGEVIGDGHGAVAGAQEVAEPPLHLLTLDPEGAIAQLDLLDESVETVGQLGDVTGIATDGRFVFAGLAGGASVAVVDSGFWTWSHIDHFHYYRGASALLGDVELAGTAPATVSAGTATTGLFSPSSGEAVLLDTAGLADGDLTERLRLEVEPHAGLIVGVGTGALVTRADAAGSGDTEAGSTRLTLVDSDGLELDSSVCTNARNAIETAVGVAVGCDEGAALAVAGGSGDSEAPSLEMIAYPAAAAVTGSGTAATPGAGTAMAPAAGTAAAPAAVTGATPADGTGAGTAATVAAAPADGTGAGTAATPAAAPAGEFRNREGRPTVAALAGDAGTTRLWLLDTRERSWQLLDAGVPLLQATAVDDADGHVLALAADGRVLVLSAETGATLAATEPLLPETLVDPSLLAGVELIADQQRAYLNAPAEHRLFEIDFADSARVSRTFDTSAAPLHLAETGR